MTPKELEDILLDAQETDRLEFKGPMSWSVQSLIKDILALSNVRDGGWIVIGIDDATRSRVGVSSTQADTFDSDIMKDQVGVYADPHVEFCIHKVADNSGTNFVVIEVESFEEFPVICKKDSSDVNRGCIYFRSKTQKPQSARVSNVNDMRDIIERSAAQKMKAFGRLGFSPQGSLNNNLDAELEGL